MTIFQIVSIFVDMQWYPLVHWPLSVLIDYAFIAAHKGGRDCWVNQY